MIMSLQNLVLTRTTSSPTLHTTTTTTVHPTTTTTTHPTTLTHSTSMPNLHPTTTTTVHPTTTVHEPEPVHTTTTQKANGADYINAFGNLATGMGNLLGGVTGVITAVKQPS